MDNVLAFLYSKKMENKWIFWIHLIVFTFLSICEAQNTQATCGSDKSCGELSREAGYAFLALGTLIGPHFIKNDNLLPGQSNIGFSAGNSDFKSINFDVNSDLYSDRMWLISTHLDLQIYNKITPAILRYGIGGGYKFALSEYLFLVSGLKFTGEKIESIEEIRTAPELNLTLSYSLSEKTEMKLGGKALFFEDLSWRVFAGIEHGFKRSETSMLSGLDLFSAVGYEENPFLQNRTYFVSLGSIF